MVAQLLSSLRGVAVHPPRLPSTCSGRPYGRLLDFPSERAPTSSPAARTTACRTLARPAAMKNSSNHFVRDAVYADWVSTRRISCGSTSGNRATISLSSCRDDQPRALAASRRHLREGVGEQRVFALSFPGAPLSGARGRHSDALGHAPGVIVGSSHFARRSCNRLLATEYRSAVPRCIE
jgi:hypothetical protein